jgi:predicted  nucleic acid-binding Zn-ribbon protein
MPHQCTDCSHVFPDGSKAMLSGCPDCGGNTFQFLPEGAISDGELGDAEAPNAAGPDTNADAADADEAPSASRRVPVESAESTSTDDPDEPVAPPEPRRENPVPQGRLERATEAVRSFVFDSPRTHTSSSRPEKSERAGDPAENEADAGSRADSDDAAEPVGSSTRNGGDRPTGGSSPPEAPHAEADAPSANAVDAGEEGAAADPSAGTDADARTDPRDRTDPDTAAGSEEVAADASNAAAEDRPPIADREDAAGTDESRPTPSDATPADAADAVDTRTPPSGAEDGRIAAEPAEDRPDLEELRQELNDQFESIKIVEPGQYELNLMELYNREEYIIALREDGRYAIEAPETWLGRRADRE